MNILINNEKLYFDVENLGLIPVDESMRTLPVMIVLHGGPGYDHTPYIGLFNSLLESVQIIYLDLHGNGRSAEGSPESWNFTRWTNDIDVFCNALGINKPIIFGHSFGGMVAMEYAIRHPDSLSKLILCNAPPKFDVDAIADAFIEYGGRKSKNAFVNFIVDPSDKNKHDYAKLCAPYYGVQKIDEKRFFYNRLTLKMDILTHFYHNVIPHFDCLDQLSKINAQTLVISGDKDPICPRPLINEMVKRLANVNCKHIVLSQTGHNLPWENNPLFQVELKKFVGNL